MSDELKEIGPEAFTNGAETVISFKGSNFYRSCDAFVRKLPDGGGSYCIRQMGHEEGNHIDFSGHSTQELTYIGDEDITVDVSTPSVQERLTDLHQGYSQDIENAKDTNGEVMVTLNVSCKSRGEVDEAMGVLLPPLLSLAKNEGKYVSLSLYDSRDY